MKDELARSMSGLRVPGQPAPYFIAYTIEDVATARINATLGALVGDHSNRARMVRVDVRVGDDARDDFERFHERPCADTRAAARCGRSARSRP
jgi:hypothetical protein